MAERYHSLRPGHVVEHLQDNIPCIGIVLSEESERLKVLTLTKRQIKLQRSRALPWTGPWLSPEDSREETLRQLERTNLLRQRIQDRLDPVEIWELLQGEVGEEGPEWLAGLIWTDPDPDHVAALGRLLLQHKTYFKFTPPVFQVLSREKVEMKLHQQERERRRNQLAQQGQALFRALWKEGSGASPASRPEPDPEIAEELREILLQQIADANTGEQASLWKSLTHGLPDQQHLALTLAQQWGFLPRHYNHLLDQAGYAWGDEWSERHLEEIRAQERQFSRLQPEEPERASLMSIDSASTRDIDDAFSVARDEEGGYRMELVLACPVLTWDFSSPLDQAVAQRNSSLYLPEGTSHMLPERLGLDLYSLRQGQSRPVLWVSLALSREGEVLSVSPRITWAEVERNTTYAATEQELDGPHPGQLATALELADKLRSNRIHKGAVIFDQKDPSIHVREEDGELRVDLEAATEHPRAQLIVSEIMILANSVLSDWAGARGLPLFHRTQDITLPPGYAGEWTDPVEMHQIIREMSASRLDIRPRPHTSLGVSGYAPITSPLRRYVDFLNLAQIRSHLQGDPPLWDEGRMESMLPHLSARSQAVARIQKFRTRYWKLLYCQRWCSFHNWEGIVLEVGDLVTVSLPREQLLLRAPKKLFGEKVHPGQKYRLTLGKIDPLNNQIKIVDAREA
ncbi:MAG: RNB domain-containing ribonuclease [Desulfohalobiaceae bacterium]|nr:RNB domain-containing ribonuclease [Desulfohalobiaceae bacterium]